jgi:hypothetical protein
MSPKITLRAPLDVDVQRIEHPLKSLIAETAAAGFKFADRDATDSDLAPELGLSHFQFQPFCSNPRPHE